eukprot:TRINITY_DN22147_c0_g1_i1.p1 TRINITY_DN22147_c0_g1~~TRINITY_DN22147_c0_g1_i1.p1  ORF type:complete len:240 (+),score=72.46 TRINITY_DN22147_c0_g1_i1:297-1016(+)
MEQIVLLLRHGGDASVMNPSTQNKYDEQKKVGKIWVEAFLHDQEAADKLAAMPSPRLFKTHAPRDLFLAVQQDGELQEQSKVIVVSRNARDACVSAYYHAANPHRLGFPFDAWLKTWAGGLFEHGTWFAWISGWKAEHAANPEQVLWVRYEDLKADPELHIRRVAQFIGVEVTDDLMAKVVLGSGFSKMKQQAVGTKNHGFFRKGTVGDWSGHFQDATLVEEFDQLYKEQMKGVDDPYQ